MKCSRGRRIKSPGLYVGVMLLLFTSEMLNAQSSVEMPSLKLNKRFFLFSNV